jgi:beta-glucanase (GH16 family)
MRSKIERYIHPMLPGRLFVCLAALVLTLAVLPGCSDEDTAWEYELIWEDEFEGPEGQLPDAANWTFDIGNGRNGWGNAQLEYDTDFPDNVSIDGNGNLAITAREESYEGFDYTSARIKTQNLFKHTRGRFEASIKLPVGQGIWPAFWLLGSDINKVGWPECGEIDIMEYRGQAPSIAQGAVHGPGYSGGSAIWRSYVLEDAGFNEDFHVFGIEWTRDKITWYIDDKRYFTVTQSEVSSKGDWVFDHDFFIILNVAVGGYFVGSPDDTTVFPQTMLVDWVRVYKGE